MSKGGNGPPLFGIILPDGSKHGRMTRRQVLDCMQLLQWSSKQARKPDHALASDESPKK